MRSQGTPQELERRRRLAVTRVLEGYPVREVATFLGVTERSVNRWMEPVGKAAISTLSRPRLALAGHANSPADRNGPCWVG